MNALTLGVQLFFTGRIVKRLGVGVTLARCPSRASSDSPLALSPTVGVVVVVYKPCAGRQLRHRPADPRGAVHGGAAGGPLQVEKSFIDTVVYRLGDQVGAWSYAGLSALGYGGHAAAIVAVPLSAAWLANSALARPGAGARQRRRLAPAGPGRERALNRSPIDDDPRPRRWPARWRGGVRPPTHGTGPPFLSRAT